MKGAFPGDASTLIYLAKANALADAAKCVAVIFVPPSVWQEAVEAGERIGAVDVPHLRAAAERGFLQRVELADDVRALSDTIARDHRLGRGESEVLALGAQSGRAIVDEGRASRVAEALGIASVSTLFLPVLGRRSGALGEREAIALLHRLAVVTGARAEAVFTVEERIRKESR